MKIGALLLLAGCSPLQSLVTSDGVERFYLVHAPEKAQGPLPVLLVFHGGGSHAEGMAEVVQMESLADSAGFLLVFPEGTGPKKYGRRFATWNAGGCCGPAARENVDDVGFVKDLLAHLAGQYSIDRQRVYATGISNGGFFSARLACELADQITAVATVGGAPSFEPCLPSRPVPTLIIHGAQDSCVPPEGGDRCGGCFSQAIEEITGEPVEQADIFMCRGVDAAAARMASLNQCSGGPNLETAENRRCQSWQDCAGGSQVKSCVLANGGHTWPSSEFTCNPRRDSCQVYMRTVGAISSAFTNREIWDFLSAYRMTE